MSAQTKPIRRLDDPLNVETPLDALADPLTPNSLFYIRNHFAVPSIDAADWRLVVGGAVVRPLEFTLDNLQGRPSRTEMVTLECAGNARTAMDPVPPGVPWGFGAVSTAPFTGVSLAEILCEAGLDQGAVEVAFQGADQGEIEGVSERFVRSLPVKDALDPSVLLAWAMNDEPLSPDHGHPLRLIVPRWYGMASVKWLVRITVLTAPFDGHFQREYVYATEPDASDGVPVTRTKVRALIGVPSHRAELRAGMTEIIGTAWSGDGAVTGVQVSLDGGSTWTDADVAEANSDSSACQWRLTWSAEPGAYVLVARATDAAGNTQPTRGVVNLRGYGNNAVQRVSVLVR